MNTIKYDYKIDIIKSGASQRDDEQRETLLKWITAHKTKDGESFECVQTPSMGIKKASLRLAVNFF